MAIQVIQQPASISFAGDPIVVKARTTLTGKTFLRIKMTCNVTAYRSEEEVSYEEKYVYEVGDDGAATFNVSDTVRIALKRCIQQQVSGTTVSQTAYAARYTLTYKEAFLEDNVEIEEGELTSEEYKALPGNLTEYERLTALNADTSTLLGSGRILSRKPAGDRVVKGVDLYVPAVSTESGTISFSVTDGAGKKDYSQSTGGVLVPASLRIATDSLQEGKLTVSTSAETGKERYVVAPGPQIRHFLFVNGFGLIESVTAVTRESLQYGIESTVYAVPPETGFRATTQVVNFAKAPKGTYGMSSGFVSQEWAEWWVNEFLVTRRAWMLMEGRYLPVAIIPPEDTTLLDRSKPGLISVSFDVRLSFTGGTRNSFVV